MIHIDLIVAVRNEQDTIIQFIKEVEKINIPDIDISILFIEDGSTDNTVELLDKLTKDKKKISYYSLKNPYRQGVALSFGLSKSTADACISLDVDGSHSIETLKEMIYLYLSGTDVVQAHRVSYKRKSFYRRIGSWLYLYFFSLFTGINLLKQNVHFRLLSNKATKVFLKKNHLLYSFRTKFKKLHNLNIAYVNFSAPERIIGESKFNFRYLVKAAFHSFLTLISYSVLFGILLFIISLSLILSYFINYIIFILSIVLCFIIFFRYKKLNSIDYLSQIEVLKTSEKGSLH